jgi:hypothetical protein
MYGCKDAPLVPRNGRKLVVGIVARISGCAVFESRSVEDRRLRGARSRRGSIRDRASGTGTEIDLHQRQDAVGLDGMIYLLCPSNPVGLHSVRAHFIGSRARNDQGILQLASVSFQ